MRDQLHSFLVIMAVDKIRDFIILIRKKITGYSLIHPDAEEDFDNLFNNPRVSPTRG
jgi:hypothetical protein